MKDGWDLNPSPAVNGLCVDNDLLPFNSAAINGYTPMCLFNRVQDKPIMPLLHEALANKTFGEICAEKCRPGRKNSRCGG